MRHRSGWRSVWPRWRRGPTRSEFSSPTAGLRRSRPRSSCAAAYGQEPGSVVPGRVSRSNLWSHVAIRLQTRCNAEVSPPWFPRFTTPATATWKACTTCCAPFAPPDELAAIFVEPIQGEGGYIVPPPEFLPGLRKICDEHKILLVLDEVQSGFGRTGKLFASEHWNIEGDIVCLAKGIASGLPLGAIVARASVMDWPSGSHASTFGGNPVACAAALASLRLIETRYRANSESRGTHLRAGLEKLALRYDFIREVRGLGLMIGAEVRDLGELPAPQLRDRIIDLAFHRGLLLLPCGASTLRFCPPLCLTAPPGGDRARAARFGHGRRRGGNRAAQDD